MSKRQPHDHHTPVSTMSKCQPHVHHTPVSIMSKCQPHVHHTPVSTVSKHQPHVRHTPASTVYKCQPHVHVGSNMLDYHIQPLHNIYFMLVTNHHTFNLIIKHKLESSILSILKVISETVHQTVINGPWYLSMSAFPVPILICYYVVIVSFLFYVLVPVFVHCFSV